MINVERWMRNENRFNRYMVECELFFIMNENAIKAF